MFKEGRVFIQAMIGVTDAQVVQYLAGYFHTCYKDGIDNV